MKAFITDYQDFCFVCGRPTNVKHHLIFGFARRRISDNDNILLPTCRDCHEYIHKHSVPARMSKVLGQVIWECNYLNQERDIRDARDEFRRRYGKTYL